MSNKGKEKLLKKINDSKMIKSLYLDYSTEDLIKKLKTFKFTKINDRSKIPFTAEIRGYECAEDQDKDLWLIKEVTKEEAIEHKIQEIAYYLDFEMNTLAAPTILIKQEDRYYRTSKIIKNAMQIGSYNYLEEPFKKIIANDLINRWLFFDEDRNPNNYMVLHNKENKTFVVAIDYNKADLTCKEMKISGNEDKFGWHRESKTRFLTLLKPEHFDDFRIEDFENRLSDLMSISKERLFNLCKTTFSGIIKNNEEAATLVSSNLIKRRKYINNYFRKNFEHRDLQAEKEVDDRYAGMGKSFIDYYKSKK